MAGGRSFLGEGLLRALVGAVSLVGLVGGVLRGCGLGLVCLVDVCWLLELEGAADSFSTDLGRGSEGEEEWILRSHNTLACW